MEVTLTALLRSRRSEDDAVLRALHDEHAGALHGYVAGLVGGDRARAEDIVQETLLRAWRTPGVLGGNSPRAWLFTVARRIAIDEWRARGRRPEQVTEHLPERGVADLSDQSVDSTVMAQAVRTLSAEHRQVLYECYYRGASTAQAAATLGIPAGTVKSRTHYALHALRNALLDLGVTS